MLLFAFVIVLFAGLAFMFLCLLRGQEKVMKTLREELAATRSRLEALERRPAPPASSDPSASPESIVFRASPEPFGSLGPLEQLEPPRPVASPFSPADTRPDPPDAPLVLLTTGMTETGGTDGTGGLGSTLPRMGGNALPVPENLPCPDQREEAPLADLQDRTDDAESLLPTRLDMNRGEPGRPELDRLEMGPVSPACPQGETRRARDARMPDLKL